MGIVILALILFISYIVIVFIESYDGQVWTKQTKSGELKIDESSIIMKIGKTIYTTVGYFSKSSKQTAKEKLERIIKKEINKNQ